MTRDLSESDIFVLLSKRRRRCLLRILRESATPLTAIELANRIGDSEYEDPSASDIRSIYLALHHNHLPRLEEADAVEYNEKGGTVRPGPTFDTLVHTLETVNEADLPWSGE